MSHEGHYREAHPLIFVITHWINLICMTGLVFTGFYIHYPFFAGFMGGARATHFLLMYIVTINLTARVLMAFWVKDANQLGSREVDVDIKNWLPRRRTSTSSGRRSSTTCSFARSTSSRPSSALRRRSATCS